MRIYHTILLNNEFDAITQYAVALLSAEQHTHFRGKQRPADEK